MNASDVIESLSIETITQILTELGAEPVKETSDFLLKIVFLSALSFPLQSAGHFIISNVRAIRIPALKSA